MRIINVVRVLCAGSLLASVLFSWAEDVGTKAAEKNTAPKDEEVTAVTVFGKLNDKKPDSQLRRIDTHRASNCNFSTNRSAAEMEEEYLDSFYGKNRAKPTVTSDNREASNDRPDPTATGEERNPCLLYTSPSPRDRQKTRMPSSA